MKIETGRLILREFMAEDWPAVHEYARVPGFSRFEEWGPNSPEDTRRFVARCLGQARARPRLTYELAVVVKDAGKLIGSAGLRLSEVGARTARLGYVISPGHQGRGLATEAARALMEWGFAQLGLEAVRATCDVDNVASWRVMEKAGMVRIAHRLGDVMLRGEARDSFEYERKR